MSDFFEVFEKENSNEKERNFSFLTDDNCEYILCFSSAHYLFHDNCKICSDVYSISFYPNLKDYKPGPKVKRTIIEVLKKFINEYNCPILFICDTTDDKGQSRGEARGKARLRLFKNDWFAPFVNEFQFEGRLIGLESYYLPIGIFGYRSDPEVSYYLNQLDLMSLG